jgi:hypothetical protein
MLPTIYMSRMDVEEDYLDKFVAWCKGRHWPDLVSIGFHSANGYLSEVGGPLACNVYEIPGVHVFDGDYTQIREVDEELKIIVREKISNHSLTVYEQVATARLPTPDDEHRPSLASSWSCPALSSIRFDVPIERDHEVADLVNTEVFPTLTSHPAFVRGRLVRESAKHPVYPSPEPRWALLLEWADMDAARMSCNSLREPFAAHFGDDLSQTAINAARHIFSLRNPSGWRP